MKQTSSHTPAAEHDRYPGTRPFDDNAADQRVFFGRDQEIQALLDQVRTASLLVLFGKSGLGKTSLLHAGLFPHLRQEDWLPLPVRVNETQGPLLPHVFETIAEQCRRSAIDYTPGNPASLWEFFKTALFLRGERLQTPVLVIDQFEELFTLQAPARRQAFVRELADLTSTRLPEPVRARRRAGETLPYSDRPAQVKMVLSLREDYLGALQELTPELPTILEQRFRLTEFGEAQARAAMEEPARVTDEPLFRTQAFRYDEEVVQQVLTFLKGRTGIIEPFQLQVLCQSVEQQVRLAQARGQTDIRVDARYLGDRRAMQALLEHFYRDAMQKIVPRQQRRRARRLCEEGLLNRLGQRLILEEQQILDTYKVRLETLNTLVDVRLLRKEPRLDGFFYEISHDSLAQPIASSRRFRIPRRVWYGGLVLLLLLGLPAVTLVLRQRHAAELAEVRAREAEARETIAEAAASKARRARADAEGLLSFLLFDLRDKLQPIGRLDVMDAVQKQVNAYYERMPVDEENAQILRQRSVAYNNQGDILRAQGNLAGALQAYQNALAIQKNLTAQDPGNTQWQRDLSVSYEKVGNVLRDQGQGAEALQAFRDSLAIARTLAAQDPDNTEWQRDLSISYNKVGDVLRDQGQGAEALQAYRDSLALRRTLAAQDPDNTEWQRDLSVSYDKVGDVLRDQGQGAEALQAYRDSLALRHTLAAQDPGNTLWQRDLSISYNKVGDVLRDQGQGAEALQAYRDSLALRRTLTAQDPGNAQWQFDLAMSFWKISTHLDMASTPARQEAKDLLQQALHILRTLQEQGRLAPKNQSWIETIAKRLATL